MYSAIRSGGVGGLSPEAKGLYDSVKQYDGCENYKEAAEKSLCEAKAVKAVQDKVFYEKAFDLAKERTEQIEALLDEAAKAKDQKEILEIQARIQGENALLQNEFTKLQMYRMMSESEDKILDQMQLELHRKNMDIAREKALSYKPRKLDPIKW